jgi:hypothetical protein
MVPWGWFAKDFEDPKDKGREDLFSATPPIEIMRMNFSRQAMVREDGEERKMI